MSTKGTCKDSGLEFFVGFGSTLKVENFAGTKFRGSKKPQNFCVSRVLNFAVAPSK